MTVEPATSVVRRQLGRRLRALRIAAGKVPIDVEEARIASRTKLWRIEYGKTTVRGGDVLSLCRLFDADYTTMNELVRLADASRETNYLEDDDGKGVEERYWLYADLEAGASVHFQYSPELVSGLLQTEDYARAVIAADTALDRKAVERRLHLRMHRQRAFFDRPDPGSLHVVMPASVLNLVVASPETMSEQVAHLMAAEERDGVSIRIVTGVHGYMSGMFSILDFDDPDDPSVVCLTSLVGTRYVERPHQVALYRGAFASIRKRTVPLKEVLE